MNICAAQSSSQDRGFARVDDYIDDVLRRRARWAWGTMDCCHFAGGWIKYASGRNPMADFSYHDEAGAILILTQGGGLLALVERAMREHGFKRTLCPEDGDIAVAPSPTGPLAIAAGSVVIRRGPWWIGKALRGIASVAAADLPAWRIG